MPAKIYKLTLTDEEEKELHEFVNHGKSAARKLTHARILLLANENRPEGAWTDEKIAEALTISLRTVERVRQRCVEQGMEAALNRKEHSRTRAKRLDGAGEARLVQLACTTAPNGREKWTMQLLAEKMIELNIVETIGRETIRTTLKKMNLNRG